MKVSVVRHPKIIHAITKITLALNSMRLRKSRYNVSKLFVVARRYLLMYIAVNHKQQA